MVVKLERKRYFLVEFNDEIPNIPVLVSFLRKKFSYLFGQIELARSSIHVVELRQNYTIIRSNHRSRDKVEVTIQLLELPNNAIPVVRHVSGTIKKLLKMIDQNVGKYRNDD